MKVTLTEKAVERGTYIIVHTFLDENGDPATPNSGLTWSLCDGKGNIINAREDVSIAAASQISIVLSGKDLALDSDDESYYDVARKVLIEGTYDSATYGAGLPIKDEVNFQIENLGLLTGTS